jgi:hypothetical protein
MELSATSRKKRHQRSQACGDSFSNSSENLSRTHPSSRPSRKADDSTKSAVTSLSKKLPIVGDYRYAEIERCDQLGAKYGIGTRMLLQAKSLKLQHPVTKEDLTIEAPLDPLIQKLLPS